MLYLCSHSFCQEQGATQGPRQTVAAERLSLPLERGNSVHLCDTQDDYCLVLTSNITVVCISSYLQNGGSSHVFKSELSRMTNRDVEVLI